jgi:F-type H+-transporting ATPase subunit epsilon
MAASSIKLDILTPLGPKRRNVEVAGVEIPGFAGELGVLPDHVPFVTPVVPGVVRFREGDTSVRIAVGAGFLEIGGDGRVAILVERALEAAEIDVAAARDGLARVNAELAGQHDSIDAAEHRKLLTQQGWCEAQIRAVT